MQHLHHTNHWVRDSDRCESVAHKCQLFPSCMGTLSQQGRHIRFEISWFETRGSVSVLWDGYVSTRGGTHLWTQGCEAIVSIHSPQSNKRLQEVWGVLEQPRDVVINDINDYADNNQGNQDCLEEIIYECLHKLLGSEGTHCQIAENYWGRKRHPEYGWDNPELDETHICERVLIIPMVELPFSIHLVISIAFIDCESCKGFWGNHWEFLSSSCFFINR